MSASLIATNSNKNSIFKLAKTLKNELFTYIKKHPPITPVASGGIN